MEYLKPQFIFVLLVLAHQSTCQQTSTYPSGSQTKVQLEDIERDNLKSAQVQSPSPQVPQQYIQYPSQEQLLYNVPVQQSAPVAQPGQQPAQPSHLFAVPNQQALFTPNQQQVVYYTHSQQPTIDFAGVSLYPSAYPYVGVVPQTSQTGGLPAEYLKALQANGAVVKTPAATPLVKTLPTQFAGNYILPAALQQPLYQPVALTQPQNAQLYYNYYPIQAPAKSLYAAGVKSTTPAVPLKSKDEPYVPIGGSANYRIEYPTQEQLNSFGKVRITG